MPDIILDTNVLSDFLVQYFCTDTANRGEGKFIEQDTITKPIAQRLNSIISNKENIEDLVIASTFAFVELTRKWRDITKGRLEIFQLKHFISQPPDWFSIANLDENILPFYCKLPKQISLKDKILPIEWTDAIHAATTLSRRSGVLATTDSRLKCIGCINCI